MISGRTDLNLRWWEGEGASRKATFENLAKQNKTKHEANFYVQAHKHRVHTCKDRSTEMLNRRPVCETSWLNG